MTTDKPSSEASAKSPLEPRKGRSSLSRAVGGLSDAPPAHAEIAELAYRLWLERGAPMGSPEIDWERAERMLLDTPRTPSNGPAPKAPAGRRSRSGRSS